MTRIIGLLVLALASFSGACGRLVFAQQSHYAWSTSVGGVPSVVEVPNVTTDVVAVTLPRFVRVEHIILHNVTGSSATVTIKDKSTHCNSAACAVIAYPLVMAAYTTYVIDLPGQVAGGGVTWSASTAHAIQGWVSGQYDRNP